MLTFALFLSLQGCITTHRVTVETWVDDGSGMYMDYLEMAPFKPVKSYVQWCKAREDNSLDCTQEKILDPMLNP